MRSAWGPSCVCSWQAAALHHPCRRTAAGAAPWPGLLPFFFARNMLSPPLSLSLTPQYSLASCPPTLTTPPRPPSHPRPRRSNALLGPWQLGQDPLETALLGFEGVAGGPAVHPWEAGRREGVGYAMAEDGAEAGEAPGQGGLGF